LNILSLAFLPVDARNHSIAILHLDHNQNLILLARDLILSERELSLEPSLLLPQTIIPSSALISTDAPPSLVVVPPQQLHGTENSASGGVLVLGGRKIRFFELSSQEWQEKYRGRLRKVESQKKNADRSSEGKAKEKQKGREITKRKAKATVEWPWNEVTAYVSSTIPTRFLTDFRWGPANDEGTGFFVGDSYGRLALLSLDSTAERTLGIIPLGEVRPHVATLGFHS
jgi:DNA damage-binding protein 1